MPLQLADLQRGDIMLKEFDGYSIVGAAISYGQYLLTSDHLFSSIVHAGILFDKMHIIESSGGGVAANHLLTGNRAYSYHVFRSVNADLADGTGTCAKVFFDIHKTHRTMNYSVPGAVKSLFRRHKAAQSPEDMDDLLTEVLGHRGNQFFCSQFVVYIYQFVSYQLNQHAPPVFQLNAGNVNPAKLARMLRGMPQQFTYIGHLLPR
ncbi:C40 family peptidase [Spirosoma fluviale]|uniref:Permuted papain-like amidase enzyme, YaeF/YiiX, C92 family n=1 Tax=Spirosoma fluviale TaxID=1597977 RepID=A0A286G3G5_9BACT|nr:hypothetical protein [Spirosoma fluviale]SOD90033.1 hypothetical protein SAMN06269250_3276 [Spirosoma fluviale]